MKFKQNLIHALLGLSLIFSFQKTKAQLSGTLTVPGTYTSLAAAITDLNLQGVNGPVTVNIAANYTETAVYGGYSVNVTGTSANPITFQKSGSGANPLIYAYSGGTATPNSVRQDGIFLIRGSDYITFDGIDILDTNSTNPATMEFGFCFFKQSQTNGCQYNTIKNCVITLNRKNNGIGTWPSGVGSRGIELVCTYAHAHIAIVPPTSAAGTNSYNKFHSNTIQNCNMGIVSHGYAAPSPYTLADFGNDIGGSITPNGNQILNFGGASSASFQAVGIQTENQYDLNVSNNVVNSNNGGGFNHPAILKGIYTNVAPSANTTINNNTVTVKCGASTVAVSAIDNASGSTPSSNTITITNNLVTNCTYATATSGIFYGIYNTASCDVLNMNNNVVTNNSSASTTGNYYSINNLGAVNSVINIKNNLVSNITITSLATNLGVSGISNSGSTPTCTLSIVSNTFQAFTFPTSTSNNSLSFINNSMGPSAVTDISYNTLGSSTLSVAGNVYFIGNFCGSSIVDIGHNIVTGTVTNNQSAFTYGYMGNNSSSISRTIHDNNFSNFIQPTTASYLWGIRCEFESAAINTIRSNTVSNLSAFNGLTVYGITSGAGGPGSSVKDNLIYNLSCTNGAYGMSIGANSNTSIDVYNNLIYGLTSLSSVSGLSIGSGSVINCYKNKIYNLQTNSTGAAVHGMDIWGAASNTLNIYNNLIGDIRQPSANCNACLVGIFFNTNTANTIINLSHNTVYLNATATATSTFGSVGLYQTYNGSAGSQLILKNNLIINNCTPVGTGSIVAFRRSNAAFGSYTTTSNNNIFYAGTPGPNRYIYFDGTNQIPSLPAFQTFVTPRENFSATELTPFTTTVGASSNYLDLNTTTPTFAESGGMPGTGITDDFGGTIRNVTTPDIGAWEGNYTYSCNPGSPAINTTPVSSTTLCSGGSTTLSASATGTISWYPSSTSTVVLGTGNTYITPTLSPGTYTYFAENYTCAPSLTRTPITIYVGITPTANAVSSATITCFNPTINLNGSGVSSYTWSGPGIVSGGNTSNPVVNAAGVYSLTGTSSGCISNTATVTVYQNTVAPTLSVSVSNNTICAGQSTTLSVSGADTYSWSTGSTSSGIVMSPTASVNYSVIGTYSATGCSGTASQSIIVSNLLLTLTSSPNTCFNACNGSITSSVSGGIAPYTFTPSSTTNLCAGMYSVIVTDNVGCITVNSITISQPSALLITASVQSVTCNGLCTGGFTLTPTGGTAPYTYTPAQSMNNLCPGPITYTVTDFNNCIRTSSFTIVQPPPFNANIATSNSVICTGNSATLVANHSGGTPPVTFLWSTSANSQSITVGPTITTVYTSTLTDNNGCNKTVTQTITVSACTGIVENSLSGFGIYPNPNSGEFTIALNKLGESTSVEIYNTLGQMIKNEPLTKLQTKINLIGEPNGIYFIRVVENGKPVYFSKIIKN